MRRGWRAALLAPDPLVNPGIAGSGRSPVTGLDRLAAQRLALRVDSGVPHHHGAPLTHVVVPVKQTLKGTPRCGKGIYGSTAEMTTRS